MSTRLRKRVYWEDAWPRLEGANEWVARANDASLAFAAASKQKNCRTGARWKEVREKRQRS